MNRCTIKGARHINHHQSNHALAISLTKRSDGESRIVEGEHPALAGGISTWSGATGDTPEAALREADAPNILQRAVAWLRALVPGSGRDRPTPLPSLGQRNEESISVDPDCPTCGGRCTVEAEGASGHAILVRCSECAPNDALGG